MTATVSTRRGALRSDSLLRFAIRTDATGCAGLGLLIAFAADPLSRVSGLSAATHWVAGAALVGYGATLYGLAAARRVRRIGFAIVVANVIFASVAMAVLAAGLLPLTRVGVGLLLATVTVTLGLAYVQYLGVRRSA